MITVKVDGVDVTKEGPLHLRLVLKIALWLYGALGLDLHQLFSLIRWEQKLGKIEADEIEIESR